MRRNIEKIVSTMSYIQKIRQKLGRDPFIHPACRIILMNERGEVLFIRRTDNGQLGIPAGAFEAGETIEEAIKREVREETGLELQSVTVIGISSNPHTEFVSYPNGDQIQYFTVEFFSDDWLGVPKADHVETKEVFWGDPGLAQQLPANEQSCFLSLADYKKTGKIRLN